MLPQYLGDVSVIDRTVARPQTPPLHRDVAPTMLEKLCPATFVLKTTFTIHDLSTVRVTRHTATASVWALDVFESPSCSESSSSEGVETASLASRWQASDPRASRAGKSNDRVRQNDWQPHAYSNVASRWLTASHEATDVESGAGTSAGTSHELHGKALACACRPRHHSSTSCQKGVGVSTSPRSSACPAEPESARGATPRATTTVTPPTGEATIVHHPDLDTLHQSLIYRHEAARPSALPSPARRAGDGAQTDHAPLYPLMMPGDEGDDLASAEMVHDAEHSVIVSSRPHAPPNMRRDFHTPLAGSLRRCPPYNQGTATVAPHVCHNKAKGRAVHPLLPIFCFSGSLGHAPDKNRERES